MPKTRILVVEDELIVAKDIQSILEDLGYDVPVIASSGKQAIEEIKKTKPDLVLMDIALGGEMDGIETSQHIRSHLKTPIIYLGAYADQETLHRATITEPFGYVHKPFEVGELHTVIEMALYKSKIEYKLKESEEKYRTLTENINVGIYRNTTGPQGKFIEVNPVMIKMFGYRSKKNFLSVNVSDLYQNPNNRKRFNEKMLNCGFVKDEELQLKKKDGTIFIGSVSAVAVKDEKGKIKYYDGLVEDITERKKLEIEKERIQALLLESQKMDAIGRLAGGVAHEFNNLLTGIMGFSDLLLMRIDKKSPLRKDIDGIKQAAKQAATLSKELLTFSRKQKIELKKIDLSTSITSIEKMLQRLVAENITLKTNLNPKLKKVKSDPELIEQLLINLVINARDAMPEGGKLLIKTENISLSEKESRTIPYALPGRFVCLSVSDTGVGMDQDTIHRMFEPFFGTKEVGKGTGLGLSVVYGIVKQHKGWINVDSNTGQGTTFKMYFPVASEKPERETKAS